MIKTDDETFNRNLEIGSAGEDIVYEYLVRNNSCVLDLRKQKRDEGAGPRLKGTEGQIVVPDFAVYNKNPTKGNFSVDSKVKNSVYTVNGKKCFTVDSKFEQYKRSTQIMQLDFVLLIFLYKNRMYAYKESECAGITRFDNQYSTGNVYIFEYNEAKIIY